MAAFCRNCGSPLTDGQAFCVTCGTRVGDVAQSAAAPPVAQPPAPPSFRATAPPPSQANPTAYSASAQLVPPAKTGMSPLVKILIAVVMIFVVFGVFAAAAMMYVGHRIHQKAQEYGLARSPEEMSESRAELRRIDGCSLLSKADVSQAVKMDVVRAESDRSDTPGCAYSVSGDAADLTAKHITAMHKGELNKLQQENVENFGKTIFHGTDAASSLNNEHPGEAPVFSFSIDNTAAQLQMRLNKATLGRMGPAITPGIPNLGDEAFDAAGAMLFIRKGDKVVRIMYMTCPCSLEDILPLARKIVDGI
jgi:uncharacterized Zn finger protein (UPF0148 family)